MLLRFQDGLQLPIQIVAVMNEFYTLSIKYLFNKTVIICDICNLAKTS